jgi:hypothetical protein
VSPSSAASSQERRYSFRRRAISDTDIHDIANARIEALAEAINILARRKRRPSDMAILIEAGSPAIELIASADEDDIAEAIDSVSGGMIIGDQIELARALGFCAGLVLQLRQALRYYCGATTVEADDGR